MNSVIKSRTVPVSSLLFLFASLSVAAGKLESVGAFPEPGASPALRAVLETAGHRVLLGDGTVLCDIWLRKAVPVSGGNKDAQGASYPELGHSVVLGVVSYPKGGKDFRGQMIKPGSYTMRYELLPDDGNHMGVAPGRDFVMLVPLAADPDPAAQFDFDQLNEHSKEASGTNHPAPLSMLPPESGEPPRAFQNADGYYVFAATLEKQGGGKLPFALIVRGEAPQ